MKITGNPADKSSYINFFLGIKMSSYKSKKSSCVHEVHKYIGTERGGGEWQYVVNHIDDKGDWGKT